MGITGMKLSYRILLSHTVLQIYQILSISVSLTLFLTFLNRKSQDFHRNTLHFPFTFVYFNQKLIHSLKNPQTVHPPQPTQNQKNQTTKHTQTPTIKINHSKTTTGDKKKRARESVCALLLSFSIIYLVLLYSVHPIFLHN